jgi:peroxiredoxin
LSVEEGRPAPDFTLNAESGESVTLSALKGSPVILYFYPKDDTPALFSSRGAGRTLSHSGGVGQA